MHLGKRRNGNRVENPDENELAVPLLPHVIAKHGELQLWFHGFKR
jgi:hypothetical protein